MFNERKFNAQLVLAGITKEQLAEAIGINASTLHRKIATDGNFTRPEIIKMLKPMKIESAEQMNEIFFEE